ncbi:MAG: dTDP-4-dehydrorhamnose reductase [Gammaproteobacteria bacterium]|nr:MAG: dTDP-4-dehydrorhamnose reductase [Gammaproteobacteria bacterium]
MKKIIVSGAGGQLGRELQATCPDTVDALFLDRHQFDITDARAVGELVNHHQPFALINAAAYTAVDSAEHEPVRASSINIEGPANLATACANNGTRFLHVSTDFVFPGRSSTPYKTSDLTEPLSIYGKTKLSGEVAVRAANGRSIIVRTGWVYSRFGSNFVKTMLKLIASRESLGIVADQVGTPTWANGLAKALWEIALTESTSGIYHYSDAGVCSWYDFAHAIADEASRLGMVDNVARILPITTADYPTPAARPAYSVLDKSRCWGELNLPAIHWRDQLRAMLNDYKEHGDA